MQHGPLASKQRIYLVLCGIATLLCILWLYRERLPEPTQLPWQSFGAATQTDETITFSSLRVAVVEQEEFHNEVLGAILHDLLGLGIKPRVFRSGPYLYRFEEILQRFYPYGYDGSIVKDAVTGVVQPGPLEEAIRTGQFDVVVLNSCHWAIWWETHIFQALESSDVHVVCILHTPQEGPEGIGKAKFQYRKLGAQGRITGLALSPHTRDTAMKLFDQWATEDSDPSWDKIPVHYIAPLFPAIANPHAIHKSSIPSKFVIQGSIDTLRRNYDGLISELLAMIKADPHAWGYQQESPGSPFIPLKKPAHGTVPPPFTLHLIGHSIREPTIPEEMKDVIHIRDSPDFDEFYDTLAEMDVLIPAFSGDKYITSVASSSIPAAVMTRTPILASPAHIRAYSYLAPPAVIVRPSSMSDAEAIFHLRAGDDLLRDTAIPGNRYTTARYSNWDEYETVLMEQNAATWRTILAGAKSRRF